MKLLLLKAYRYLSPRTSCDADQAIAVHGIGVSGCSTAYNVAVGGTDFGDSYLNENSTYWNATNTGLRLMGQPYSTCRRFPGTTPAPARCCLITLPLADKPWAEQVFATLHLARNFLPLARAATAAGGCAYGNPSVAGVVSGSCQGYSKPYWQSLVGVPHDGVRAIPDVSAFCSQLSAALPICYTDPAGGACLAPALPKLSGGPAMAAPALPSWPAFRLLVNQKHGRQGNPNPTYYWIANAEYRRKGTSCNSNNGNTVGSGCVFYDVTMGDMDVNCTPLVVSGKGKHTTSIPYNCYLRQRLPNGVLSTE